MGRREVRDGGAAAGGAGAGARAGAAAAAAAGVDRAGWPTDDCID